MTLSVEFGETPVVCILGMHRSGTSCLAGSLQQAGLHLGKYHSWNRFNQKGSRENQDIVDFNDALLAANRGSWEKPPGQLRFSRADVERARGLIRRYGGEQPWGFKDPRTLLTLPLWREAAVELKYVGIFRHPRAVAESLRRRSGGHMGLSSAMALWGHYNQLLYDAWRREQFPLLCFDWEEQRFLKGLADVAKSLALAESDAAPAFFSRDLLHYQGQRWDQIPFRIKRLYQQLAAASEG